MRQRSPTGEIHLGNPETKPSKSAEFIRVMLDKPYWKYLCPRGTWKGKDKSSVQFSVKSAWCIIRWNIQMVADETLKAKPEIFHSDHKITKNAKTWGNHNKHNIHKYSPRTIYKLHRFVLTYDTIDLLVPWISVVTQEEIVKCVCVGWESDREKSRELYPVIQDVQIWGLTNQCTACLN